MSPLIEKWHYEAKQGGIMKITMLFDNSITAFAKEPKQIIIQGAQAEDAKTLVDEYFRPVMLAMGYTTDTVDEYLGAR